MNHEITVHVCGDTIEKLENAASDQGVELAALVEGILRDWTRDETKRAVKTSPDIASKRAVKTSPD